MRCTMKNQNGYVDSFAKLIQCPTVTNSGHEYFDAFHKVLDEEFPHVTATCKKIEVGGDVLCTNGAASHRVVLSCLWRTKTSFLQSAEIGNILLSAQRLLTAKCMAEAQWTAKTPSFPPYKPSKNSLNKVLCPNKTFI